MRLSVNVFGSDPESQLSTLKLAAGFLFGAVCNFLGSVLPQQRFEMADQCYSLVTAS